MPLGFGLMIPDIQVSLYVWIWRLFRDLVDIKTAIYSLEVAPSNKTDSQYKSFARTNPLSYF